MESTCSPNSNTADSADTDDDENEDSGLLLYFDWYKYLRQMQQACVKHKAHEYLQY